MLSCTCTDRSLAVIRETYGDGTSVTVQISRNTEGTTDKTGRWSETRHSTLWQMTSDPRGHLSTYCCHRTDKSLYFFCRYHLKQINTNKTESWCIF